ncbi:DNA-binding protein WhiA [Mobilitalea sibirica]|uniref:Probable cell division protein WhiA n=1 Tax=Mobilitalea sibirica TaxID=1462919 RepID=A0A8J7HEK2_9FIRM|nr:DNA-binding protein WhiA [Mobilitalea sibirica]MBH1942559.1 DNA-binding protein WhiA [Mobilitalea sibirica]
MSFSKDVKEELSLQLSTARHCRLAELSAILIFGGQFIKSGSKPYLKLQTESIVVARKYFTLIRKTFNINIDISVRRNMHLKENQMYSLIIMDQPSVIQILQAAKLPYEDIKNGSFGKVNQLIVQNACCKRAFIRGAFLSSGSMSNPKKAYHFEIVVTDMIKAEQLRDMIQTFSIDAKIVKRKKNYVVYIKEGSQIVEILNVMEAHVALMDLENVRILKEMRNSINRQVNCEAANINKTVVAASKQIDDIIFIRDHIGFGDLAEGLEEIAMLRIQHPEASLKELGTMLLPPIGKSGVNHRLRKLSMIADNYREHKEENRYDN